MNKTVNNTLCDYKTTSVSMVEQQLDLRPTYSWRVFSCDMILLVMIQQRILFWALLVTSSCCVFTLITLSLFSPKSLLDSMMIVMNSSLFGPSLYYMSLRNFPGGHNSWALYTLLVRNGHWPTSTSKMMIITVIQTRDADGSFHVNDLSLFENRTSHAFAPQIISLPKPKL